MGCTIHSARTDLNHDREFDSLKKTKGVSAVLDLCTHDPRSLDSTWVHWFDFGLSDYLGCSCRAIGDHNCLQPIKTEGRTWSGAQRRWGNIRSFRLLSYDCIDLRRDMTYLCRWNIGLAKCRHHSGPLRHPVRSRERSAPSVVHCCGPLTAHGPQIKGGGVGWSHFITVPPRLAAEVSYWLQDISMLSVLHEKERTSRYVEFPVGEMATAPCELQSIWPWWRRAPCPRPPRRHLASLAPPRRSLRRGRTRRHRPKTAWSGRPLRACPSVVVRIQ